MIIIPTIQEHKLEYNKFIKKDKSLILLKDKSLLLQEKLKKEKLKYSRLLNKLTNTYNGVELPKLLTKYFTDFNIVVKEKVGREKNYYIDVDIASTTNNPKNLYLFIDELPVLSNVIEIIYPIKFESNNAILKIDFTVRVYVLY
jgi:hypothetical protein